MKTMILEFKKVIKSGSYAHIVDQKFSDDLLNDLQISGSKILNCVFENIHFKNCNLQASELSNCKFINCTFENCTSQFDQFSDCNFISCSFENMICELGKFKNCNYLSSYFNFIQDNHSIKEGNHYFYCFGQGQATQEHIAA